MPATETAREQALSRLAATLKGAEAVRDAVLIGSSVYAPDLARDVDLVLTVTGECDGLRDRLTELFGDSLDLIVRRPGDEIGSLALAVLAGRVVAGDGWTVAEAEAALARRGGIMASFEEAAAHLAAANEYLNLARRQHTGLLKDTHYATAFDSLFHAARVAALVFMGSDRTGWGGIEKRLPPPWGAEFRAMASTLHLLYAYDRKFPRQEEKALAEFRRWKGAAEKFVAGMRELVTARERERDAVQEP